MGDARPLSDGDGAVKPAACVPQQTMPVPQPSLSSLNPLQLLGNNVAEARKAAGGRFDHATVKRLATGMLRALEEVHAAGFVHRDVKPANFAVSPYFSDALTGPAGGGDGETGDGWGGCGGGGGRGPGTAEGGVGAGL